MKLLLFFLKIILLICLFQINLLGQIKVQNASGKIKVETDLDGSEKVVPSEGNETSIEENEWFTIKNVSLYGGGSLLGLVTSTDDTQENTSPSGSIGINLETDRIIANLFFSYNGREVVDMMTLEQFGNSLMNPNLAGQSISFSLLGKINNYFGVSGNFKIADNLWKLDSIKTIDSSPLVARIGFYFRPFNFDLIKNNNVDFTLNCHFTHRALYGDFGNNSQIIENQTIERRGYNGFDISANIYLNAVQLYMQLSRNSKGDFEVPGFTGTQVLFGVNVTGDIISLFKKNND